jgi:hypothetical protein
MSTGSDRRNTGESVGARDAPPLAPDRPVVDTGATPPEEIRAEVADLDDERVQHIEELRADVAATVDELAARLDVPARVAAGKDEAVTAVRYRVQRARSVTDTTLTGLRDTLRERPALVAAAAALLVLVLGGRRRTRRRAGR